MEKNLRQIIHDNKLEKATFLLAISGGVDSMVLASLFYQEGLKFAVAHCNFGLRQEADEDEQMVKEYCQSKGIIFYAKKFETLSLAQENKMGIQEAARELRYAYFKELALENEIQYVVTAHHADDNIETVLFNLFRGTGLKGLKGMPMLHQQLFRPFLYFTKKEIIAYASENNIAWREDLSNSKNDYTRNFLRNEILPSLATHFPNLEEKMTHTILRLNETEKIYKESIDKLKKKLVVQLNESSFKIPIRKLKLQTPLRTILYELFSDIGVSEKQLDEIIKLMNAPSGAKQVTATHIILNHRNHLIVEPISEKETTHYIIDQEQGTLSTSQGEISWHLKDKLPNSFTNNPKEAFLDAKFISFPIIIRAPRQADYFYPLGLNKKKKVSRFFIDQKISSLDKEKQLVLETNKKNAWILGLRIDDRFKVTEKTKQILHLKINV